MIKILEVKVGLDFSKQSQLSAIASFLGVKETDIKNFKILKKSIDARNKKNIAYKCNFAVEIDEKLVKNAFFEPYVEEKRLKINKINNKSAVVVGSGPAGLFCALTLAKANVKVTLLEKGERMEKRVKTVETYLKTGKFSVKSNIQEGEGGAGTFSDGKLNSGINSFLAREVLHIFHENGAGEEVLYENRPHVGTDVIRDIVVRIRKQIEKLGGKVLFESKFMDFEETDNGIEVTYVSQNKEHKILADNLILALGYSARDTHRMLEKKGMTYKQKPFSIGYRIEHLQADINKMQYGEDNPLLPPAEYRLFEHLESGRTVYTFCMCPGGEVVPAVSGSDEIVTNGMSYHGRKGKNANSAVLVSVSPSDYGSEHPLAGIDFQEKLEKEAYKKGDGCFIVSNVEDFLNRKTTEDLGIVQPTIRPKYVLGDVGRLLPLNLVNDIREGIKRFAKKLKGFDKNGVLTGIETRSSAPFCTARQDNLQTNFKNVYAIGEGAGMAGGIMSSAVDGMKIALKIIEENSDANI